MKIWSCKIGETDEPNLRPGADAPMRDAVERAYKEITGEEPAFIFSGWGAELTEGERAAHEDRLPRWELTEAGREEALTSRAERAEAAEADLRAEVEQWKANFGRDALTNATAIMVELADSRATVERVRAIHVRGQDNLAERLGLAVPDMCLADGETWPCPTIAALDGTGDAQRPAEPDSCPSCGRLHFPWCEPHGGDGYAQRPAEERHERLSAALARVPFAFWICPVDGHSDRRGPVGELVGTVDWREGVAYCTAPGCDQSSAQRPAEGGPEGEVVGFHREQTPTGDRVIYHRADDEPDAPAALDGGQPATEEQSNA